ncbi:peptidyl-prolyl cis-trans isomerase FKBP4 [Trichonephila clavata]|uniref:Peptidyl-prolyl cis-trans isomerase FKBP4 n=1 Tax=Trichonephila clavata TaxID=2740835 RepID=A0A8X6J1A5_TRICU|nr:peptidyl-prolyl cis-trans isomerase FKBP4 [Trichonephila clavata]
MPALKVATLKPFIKEIIAKGYGFHTPQDGSVCKIKIIADEQNVITDLNDSSEKEIVVGDVDEPIDRIIEDCIRTMKEEEICCLKFEHPCLGSDFIIPSEPTEDMKNDQNLITDTENDNEKCDSDLKESEQIDTGSEDTEDIKTELNADQETSEISDIQPDDKNLPSNFVEIQFQLLSYTREPEIWEMSVTEKWRRATYHKQRGLELYSRGAYQYAFRRFGLTLKYVISLEHDIPSGQEEGMDIKGLKLSCYLNVAACQMRHHNYESVVINSSKALSLQSDNAKALYRRGAAYVQLQEYEKAKEDLTAAQQLEPKNQAVSKQLQLLKSKVQKLNQYYASAMKKLFT